ncbi:hypothetical protein M0813_21481 [Anaeramoeba flamelloides]|uniref:Uncharacterized protein n=1 Tax=Anaeramoeba flamelloides TaxID=1746091 RepID=A0ABQ8YHY6_9EUKA|nr:hypothetical protein M0813_21481 [Anaeramoeba flamelloides]
MFMNKKQGISTNKSIEVSKDLIIGPFHYNSVNLETVGKEVGTSLLEHGVISFYIPPDELSYENDKVITRWLWSSGKDEYSIFSDIVPILIHSSRYLPRKNLKQYHYGFIANFKYVQKKVNKMQMKRKNGIRSRFSSKETSHLVKILNLEIIATEKAFPNNLFYTTPDWHNYHKKIDLQNGTKCSISTLNKVRNQVKYLNNSLILDPHTPPMTRAKSRELSLTHYQNYKYDGETVKKDFKNTLGKTQPTQNDNKLFHHQSKCKKEKTDSNQRAITKSHLKNIEKNDPLDLDRGKQGFGFHFNLRSEITRKRPFDEEKFSFKENKIHNNLVIVKKIKDLDFEKQNTVKTKRKSVSYFQINNNLLLPPEIPNFAKKNKFCNKKKLDTKEKKILQMSNSHQTNNEKEQSPKQPTNPQDLEKV